MYIGKGGWSSQHGECDEKSHFGQRFQGHKCCGSHGQKRGWREIE